MEDLSTEAELHYYIRNVLTEAAEGKSEFYFELVAVIHRKERVDDALLVAFFNGLSGSVSSIHSSHHKDLLTAIFNMSLWDYEPEVMDAFVEFLICLGSASGDYLRLCLEVLVKNLRPPSYYLSDSKIFAKNNDVFNRIRYALDEIERLVPVSPRELECIVKSADHKPNRNGHFIRLYSENFLQLATGRMGALVGRSLLILILDLLLDLDVEIPPIEILQDFEWHGNDVEAHKLSRAMIMKLSDVEKLESLMVLVFDYLQSCRESGSLDKVLPILLQSFGKTYLSTKKPKFVQFLLFYACSLDPEGFGMEFAIELVKTFINQNEYPQLRMSAIAYLPSYLARAKFVSAEVIGDILERVVNWCFEYCKNLDGHINPRAHNIFYGGCQAIMYVLCFRMREMLSEPLLKSEVLRSRIEEIFMHPLRPLQVCMHQIVGEFLHLASEYHILTLPTSVKAIENGLQESESTGEFSEAMFFPFDPCSLRKCESYIGPIYLRWEMLRANKEEDGFTSDGEEDLGDGDEMMIDSLSKMAEDSTVEFDNGIQRCSQMPSRIKPSIVPNFVPTS